MDRFAVEGEIVIAVWIRCPECGDPFDLTDTVEWREGLFKSMPYIMEPIFGIDLAIDCPSCGAGLKMTSRHRSSYFKKE